MPSFNNLLDILDWHEKTEVSNPAIDSAICCITQIACLLRFDLQTFLENLY